VSPNYHWLSISIPCFLAGLGVFFSSLLFFSFCWNTIMHHNAFSARAYIRRGQEGRKEEKIRCLSFLRAWLAPTSLSRKLKMDLVWVPTLITWVPHLNHHIYTLILTMHEGTAWHHANCKIKSSPIPTPSTAILDPFIFMI